MTLRHFSLSKFLWLRGTYGINTINCFEDYRNYALGRCGACLMRIIAGAVCASQILWQRQLSRAAAFHISARIMASAHDIGEGRVPEGTKASYLSEIFGNYSL